MDKEQLKPIPKQQKSTKLARDFPVYFDQQPTLVALEQTENNQIIEWPPRSAENNNQQPTTTTIINNNHNHTNNNQQIYLKVAQANNH